MRQIRKIILLIMTTFILSNSFSQNYTISFTVTGATSSLDSVKIENLTHPANAIWYNGDILQLVLSTGINEIAVKEINLRIYPNPMHGQAELLFYAKQDGNVLISIYDISGKKVLETEDMILMGTQKYMLTGLKQGVYCINIRGNNYFYASKIISQNEKSSFTKIKYVGYDDIDNVNNRYKSNKALVSMPYFSGDILRFTAYSDVYFKILTDVITADKTISFNFAGNNTVTDIDGNVYDTIHIGNQVWLKQNLNVSKYNNGNPISNITDGIDWYLSATSAYCNYNNDINNSLIYGKIYNYYVIHDINNVCPIGWHIPSNSEWEYLVNYLGGENIAGGKLKETGTIHWNNPNNGATNESGFTGLPGGMRFVHGEYWNIGTEGRFWSTSVFSTTEAYYWSLRHNAATFIKSNSYKEIGASVRCLKD